MSLSHSGSCGSEVSRQFKELHVPGRPVVLNFGGAIDDALCAPQCDDVLFDLTNLELTVSELRDIVGARAFAGRRAFGRTAGILPRYRKGSE